MTEKELRYTPKELRIIEKHLEDSSKMPYSEFHEFFHGYSAQMWGYFECLCRWIEHNPTKVKLILQANENLFERKAKQDEAIRKFEEGHTFNCIVCKKTKPAKEFPWELPNKKRAVTCFTCLKIKTKLVAECTICKKTKDVKEFTNCVEQLICIDCEKEHDIHIEEESKKPKERPQFDTWHKNNLVDLLGFFKHNNPAQLEELVKSYDSYKRGG